MWRGCTPRLPEISPHLFLSSLHPHKPALRHQVVPAWGPPNSPSCLLQVLKVARIQAREWAMGRTRGAWPPTQPGSERRPHPGRKHSLLCRRLPRRGRPPWPEEQLRQEVRTPPPLQWRWHMGAPARTGRAGRPPSQEELPALLRAGLRRDHISAPTKPRNGGAGSEMPLKGRGWPGFLFPGGEQGPWGRRPGLPREQPRWSLWRQLPRSIYNPHWSRGPCPRPPFLGA